MLEKIYFSKMILYLIQINKSIIIIKLVINLYIHILKYNSVECTLFTIDGFAKIDTYNIFYEYKVIKKVEIFFYLFMYLFKISW
jgi:hypothetical protein